MDGTSLYRWMLLSRELELVLGVKNQRWFPAEGEEAVIVGSFCDLRDGDAVAPHYRGPFVVYAMRGAELWRLISQALGKRAGYNKGRSVPFTGPFEAGVVPWVAGDLGTTIGTATGAALAFSQERSDRVCVCTFGDGTTNRGDFHENVNLASVWNLPIVYVCQNNGWAISQRAAGYLPAPVVDRAAGYGIPGIQVDGDDVEAVRQAVTEATARARQGGGPTLVEALTGRKGGHWAGDKTPYRTEEDAYTGKDPLQLLAVRLTERGEATAEGLARIRSAVSLEIEVAMEKALAQDEPENPDLEEGEVYA